MKTIKILLCALALSGCSAAIQPSFDGGPRSDGGYASDAHCPDTAEECASIPLCLFACRYDDAGADPDLGPELDAGLEPDAGDLPDLGTDAGPAPDLGAGIPACGWAVTTPVVLCADDRCCNEGCQPDGTCRFGHAASRSFCTCDHVTCPAGGTTCDAGLVGVCACP